MAWLVTGAHGMLGREVVAVLRERGDRVWALGRDGLDIGDPRAVDAAVRDRRPDVVVNCAGWTRVDDAEEHEPEALRTNGDGVRHLSLACRAAGARLVHLSTDYVFDGTAARPYAEDHPPHPISAYGRTKLAGERAVLGVLPDTGYVVRTAWLYGRHGRNFVTTMIALEAERDTLEVVADQRGQPTWARDVARQIVPLADSGAAPGIYHATNAGEATWHALAQEVFRLLGADERRVRPTTAERFRRPAPRPAYSVLGHGRWAEAGRPPPRDWRSALRAAFPSLLEEAGRRARDPK
ncbi:dTDP-4-dehydrorhamnose reductase [Spirillospora sp. NPDC127200]